MTTRIAIYLVPAVLLLAIGLGYSTTTRSEGTEEAKTALVSVRTLEVEPADSYVVRRSFTGSIVARRSIDLGFEVAGRLVEVSVEQGQQVTAGQSLARLDTRHLLARRQLLEAERAQASAVLAELEAGPRREVIDAARATVRDLKAQLDLSRLNLERRATLRRQKAISQQEYDEALFGYRAAEARLDTAQRKLDELEAGTRQEQIDAQRAAVAALDASLADLAHDLEDTHLVAPFDATVVERYADEGAVVSPSMPIVRLVESGHLEAWIGLPSQSADQLAVGQSHEVTVQQRRYAARVTAVVAELDLGTRTRRVVLSLDSSASDSVVPGQVVRLELEQPVDGRGYWLPTSALVRGNRGLWSCYAVVPNREEANAEMIERRDLEILYTQGERVFVRGTLTPGDVIVADGTHRVVAGQLVRRAEQTAATTTT